MSVFSKSSEQRLASVDSRLVEALRIAILHVDFAIVCGHRGKEEQNAAHAAGKSKLKWPESKHNTKPSKAVDICPTTGGKLDWNNANRFKHIGFFILGILAAKGTKARLGGDWDRDFDTADEKFVDLPHIELLD